MTTTPQPPPPSAKELSQAEAASPSEHTPPLISFGEKLARLLKERGISQRKFDKILGVGDATTNKIINDKMKLTAQRLKDISKALGFESVLELIDGTDLMKEFEDFVEEESDERKEIQTLRNEVLVKSDRLVEAEGRLALLDTQLATANAEILKLSAEELRLNELLAKAQDESTRARSDLSSAVYRHQQEKKALEERVVTLAKLYETHKQMNSDYEKEITELRQTTNASLIVGGIGALLGIGGLAAASSSSDDDEPTPKRKLPKHSKR